MRPIRVGVIGYGTIGKRVAQAVLKQDDMVLEGVCEVAPSYATLQAFKSGVKIYVSKQENVKLFEELGIKVSGLLEDLLNKIDVVVDATPAGVGEKNKPIYEKFGIKQVYEGGEKAHVAQLSFSSLCNYEEAVGKSSARVVSCNTTALLRLICTLHKSFGVEKVQAVIIRRGADPKEVERGPINSVELDPPKTPSHHAYDVKTVLPWLDIYTAAVVVPTTLMHVHHVTLRLTRDVEKKDVINVLSEAPRIMLIPATRLKISGTAGIVEAAREVRQRYDVPELMIFEDSISVSGREVHLFQAVHQESIVIPENVDAIRALAGIEKSPEVSIKKTDKSLGLTKSLW
ncbi:MAG: type II glyceraldehyde-3-phosphate dehydrogenase [Acidilobaceae archaeon]